MIDAGRPRLAGRSFGIVSSAPPGSGQRGCAVQRQSWFCGVAPSQPVGLSAVTDVA